MFTGIIEALGQVKAISKSGENVTYTVSSPFTHELIIDQSVAHNGVCLTVVGINGDQYDVTAVKETLDRTNIGSLAEGSAVNLERCTVMGGRLDGHIVQGHVDQTGKVRSIEPQDGSWKFTIEHAPLGKALIIEKGSIAVNGTSLTVVDVAPDHFTFVVIPHTMEKTVLGAAKVGDIVNLEFDIVGKYILANEALA